jgi:hypothetical protein
MSTATTPHLPTPNPGPRYWTREEYYRLADLGFFRGQRAERIGGQIMVLTQAPLELGQSSDPEPDVSVVAGSRADYSDHPTTAVLVVEVSDTTLAFDRGDKALGSLTTG